MTIFDWLKQITSEKKSWASFTENQQESFNSYMIHRFVSMYEPYVEVANIGQSIPYPWATRLCRFLQGRLQIQDLGKRASCRRRVPMARTATPSAGLRG